jgi:flagellar hook assembly protein FlgD
VLTVRSVEAGSIRIQIFDASGRLVRTLLDRSFSEGGYHDVAIDGRRDDGARLGSGVYFYRVQAKGGTATGRFTILN